MPDEVKTTEAPVADIKSAYKTIVEANQARVKACQTAVGEVLSKYGCKIEPQVIITSQGFKTGVTIQIVE